MLDIQNQTNNTFDIDSTNHNMSHQNSTFTAILSVSLFVFSILNIICYFIANISLIVSINSTKHDSFLINFRKFLALLGCELIVCGIIFFANYFGLKDLTYNYFAINSFVFL